MRCHVVNLLPASRELQAYLPDRGQTERTGLLISTRTMVVMVVCANQTMLTGVWQPSLRNGVAVGQSRNRRHTSHLPLAGADNYLSIVPVRAITRDYVRRRESAGVMHEPHLRSTGRPTQPESVACESTSMSCSRVEIRPDSTLISLRGCCASVQAQNLTVFRSRATRSYKHYGFWQVF